jgi:hypothetical protein
VTLAPLPTPPPVVVQVDGAVARPGVYSLPAGSRVRHAVQAAGGLLPAAESGSLNQAAILKDGERIAIPEQSSATATATPFPKNTLNQTAARPPPASSSRHCLALGRTWPNRLSPTARHMAPLKPCSPSWRCLELGRRHLRRSRT